MPCSQGQLVVLRHLLITAVADLGERLDEFSRAELNRLGLGKSGQTSLAVAPAA